MTRTDAAGERAGASPAAPSETEGTASGRPPESDAGEAGEAVVVTVEAGPPGALDQDSPAAPVDGGRSARVAWLGLAVVLGAEIMDLLDATITSVAGPTVRAALDGGAGQLQWFSAAYTLAFAMFLITGARLGDIHGRRRVFLVGVAAFTITSALCGLATSPEMLIAARGAQGLAAALMVPQGFGLLRDLFPPERIGAAFAVFGPAMGLASVGGPLLGGVLADSDLLGLGWRAIFFVNVPVGVVTFVLAARILPAAPPAGRRPRLDLAGVGLVTLATLLVVHPLVQGREAGWPAWTWLCMAGAVAVFALFAGYERRLRARGADALVEPGLFRNRAFSGALAVGLAIFASMVGLMFTFALYLQAGLGRSAGDTALAMVPWSVGMVIGAALSGGWLGPRYGRRVLHGGLLIGAAGVAGLALTVRGAGAAGPSGWEMAPALLITGIGIGLAMAPFFDIALAGVADHEVGSASGTLNAVQQLAGTLGVAVLGTVYFEMTDGLLPGAAWMAGSGDAFVRTVWVMAGTMLVAAALAFLMPRQAREDGAGH